jgi:5-(carboxyamino)imidazole ribonucleotide synthase
MVNLLGDLWENGEPDWEKVLSQSGLHLHLYGKGDARVGRKMGHITALGETAESAKKLVEDAFRKLGGGE